MSHMEDLLDNLTLPALKIAAEKYLDSMPHGETVQRIIGSYPVRDLVILAMSGFACAVIENELRSLGAEPTA